MSKAELLAGAAAVLGVVIAETLTSAPPAQATQGSAVVLGQEKYRRDSAHRGV